MKIKLYNTIAFNNCKLTHFGVDTQIMILHRLKNQINRIIKLNYTLYSFSFFSFKILHRFIKPSVIPTLNRVYSQLKSQFLKTDSKNLKNLNNSKNLKIDLLQTIHTIKMVGSGLMQFFLKSP